MGEIEFTRRLKEFAHANGAHLIGIAPVERLEEAPEGHRPTDHLPEATHVIVCAMKIPFGSCERWMKPKNNSWRWYGYKIPNYLLPMLAFRISNFLEMEGYMALPIPHTVVGMDPKTFMMELSHRHAAVAAGLGVFGWANFVISPQFGPRIRLVSIITQAPLIADPMYHGRQPCQNCRVCVEACPAKAIGTKGRKCRIGGIEFEYGTMDIHRCRWFTEGIAKETSQINDFEMPEVIDQSVLMEYDEKKNYFQRRTEHMMGYAAYCGKCQVICQAGKDAWANMKREMV
jgi:epoxyqueuosine reductase QueG